MVLLVPTLAARALAVALTATAASGAARADVAEQVAALLAPSPAAGERSQTEDPARKLVALGEPAVAPLLDGLAGSGWSERPLDGAPRGIAIAALTELPRPAVRTELERRSSGAAGQRVAVLDVLADLARPGDGELVLRAGAPVADEGTGSWEVQRAFERCLAALLARHPGSVSALAAMIPDAHPTLLWILVREVGETRTPEAFEALGRELGRVEGADVLLLDQLRELAPRASFAALREVRPAVHWALRSNDRLERLAACHAAAALEDIDAVEGLIGLLGEGDEAVRQAARAALTSLTGKILGPDPDAWWAWLRAETSWWEAEGLADLERARTGGGEELPAAVRRLARGLLFRDRIVPELVPLLDRGEPEVIRLVSSVLATLGSREAAPALESLLDHADTTVQGSARKALRRLRGSPQPGGVHPGTQLAARRR
jgi:hypothetical protein